MLDADLLRTNLRTVRGSLASGERALCEAERLDASPDEILRLCDEVITRRISLHLRRLEAGEPVTLATLTQLERDEALLGQFVSAASHG